MGSEKKKKWTHFEGPLLRSKYFGHQCLFELVKVDFHGMILMVMCENQIQFAKSKELNQENNISVFMPKCFERYKAMQDDCNSQSRKFTIQGAAAIVFLSL